MYASCKNILHSGSFFEIFQRKHYLRLQPPDALAPLLFSFPVISMSEQMQTLVVLDGNKRHRASN